MLTHRPRLFLADLCADLTEDSPAATGNTRVEESKNVQTVEFNQPAGKWVCQAKVVYFSGENDDYPSKAKTREDLYINS